MMKCIDSFFVALGVAMLHKYTAELITLPYKLCSGFFEAIDSLKIFIVVRNDIRQSKTIKRSAY